MSTIKTRVLILSDTHGLELQQPLPRSADVAIHCGDITDGSKLEEYHAAIYLLHTIDAPLKLIIAGNHDFTLDDDIFRQKIAESGLHNDIDLVRREYGDFGEARKIINNAKNRGILYLEEGNHEFTLQNGAHLKLFASPLTPGQAGWGFQYSPAQGHDFAITPDTDIVVTHGPPRGILDMTRSKTRAGCPDLFKAVVAARPLLHCFGHIHEGWGAKRIAWKQEMVDGIIEEPSHFNTIDNDKSATICTTSMQHSHARLGTRPSTEQHIFLGFDQENGTLLNKGEETLFVNAAMLDEKRRLGQTPFLVALDLPRVSSSFSS